MATEPQRYLILSTTDAELLYGAIHGFYPAERIPEIGRAVQRLRDDTGADLDAAVESLKSMPPCAACVIEAQERYCCAWSAQQFGRRLSRLLRRARHEIRPGETAEQAKNRKERDEH